MSNETEEAANRLETQVDDAIRRIQLSALILDQLLEVTTKMDRTIRTLQELLKLP